jgi:hypothetical protein
MRAVRNENRLEFFYKKFGFLTIGFHKISELYSQFESE